MRSIKVDGKAVKPSKVVCIGRNYVEHIAELGNEVPDEMVVFIKPNSAISSGLTAHHQEPLHYEGELCFVYQQGKFSAVGFGLDLTKRELQSKLKAKGLPWERAKAFDGAAVLGHFVSIDNIDDNLRLELKIDDKLIQAGGISLMMYKPDIIVEQLKQFITLEDGDVVMTGTPKGVGVVSPAARFDGAIYCGNTLLASSHWVAT
ncbi:fumarylacetoacetate hydrolase family protein [Neptunicella sp. SCSIO 80796]|uniref:fumarylacetoacetate hydrolase family protein n=1 Tax=Neptunicella plasticusilytica TaxID=3117012 RepID=UPI003A4E2FE9